MAHDARQRATQFNAVEKQATANVTLVIGNIARWTAEGRPPVKTDVFEFTEFAHLTQQLIDSINPDIILSPLMADDFDVVDVADRLHALGYCGCYRAITSNIPNADMIRAEVRNHAPEVDFDLLMMSPVANDG